MNFNNTVEDPKNAVSVTDKTNYKTTIIIDKHRSFLQRLFPTNLQRMLNKSDLTQAATELELREKAFKMAKESQLHSIKEIYNDFLIKNTGETRKERALFFAQEFQELQSEIGKITSMFYDLIQTQYSEMNKISLPFLKEMEKKRIEESAGRFNCITNKLIVDFQNILNEAISA